MPETIEVGDWVQIRGLKRIYEVEQVKTVGTDTRPCARLKLAGHGLWHTPEAVTRLAPRFWIKARP